MNMTAKKRQLPLVVGALALLAGVASPALAQLSPCAITADIDAAGAPRLRITGSNLKQVVTIVVNPAVPNANVSVDCNGDGDLADATDLPAANYAGAFDTYDIQPKGNDTVNFSLVDGAYNGVRLNPQILLGSGTNTVNLNFTGDALQASSRVLIDIAGGAATDSVTITLPALDASAFQVKAEMGSGNDAFTINQPVNISAGSSVPLEVNLGLGTNSLTYNMAGFPTQIGFSNLSLNVEGGTGLDTVTLNLAGRVNASRTYFAADLGAGNDKFRANLDLGNFIVYNNPGLGEAHFDVNGGGGANTMTVARNGTTGGSLVALSGFVEMRFKGGTGPDTIMVDVDDLFEFGNSIGYPGTFRVRADGGGGNDTINVTATTGALAQAGAQHDVVITGGVGNDKININYTNDSGFVNTPATYAPAGRILLDGVVGSDTCTVTTNTVGIVNKRGCEY
jgi:hypothetical protein